MTVNSVNVNENSINFIEPTIDDFNDVVKAFVMVLAFLNLFITNSSL